MSNKQIAAVHKNGSNLSQRSHRTRRRMESPSLFSWLDCEKVSVIGSINSERPNSQMSDFSGCLSGTEDEFMRVGVDSGNYSLDKVGNHNYHKVIVDLNNELLSAKTENIQIKFKLDEVRASLELEWTEKVRRLSNENRSILEEKIDLERTLQELRKRSQTNDFLDMKNKIELLESERAKDEIELFQSRNYIQDLQIKLETKEKAGANLKEQIVELHSKNQEIFLKFKRLENEAATTRNEMEMLRKSEGWYKNELHECQNKKLKVQEDVMILRNELQMERNKNTRMYTEFTQLLRNCEDIEAKAIREKESMMRKLENIQANLGETMDKNHFINHVRNVSDHEESLRIIENLKEELSAFNHKSDQQDGLIKQLEKENNSLLSTEASLQGKLADTGVASAMLENRVKELEENLKLTQSQCESFSYQNLDLKTENERLTLHFESMANEKTKIDETVQKLRDDFEVIMTRFKKLTEELSEKEKRISELTVANASLQQRLPENELLIDMSTENQLLKSDVINSERKVKCLMEELEHFKRINHQFEAELKDMKTKNEIKVQEIELLNESNHVGRQEISQLTQQLQNLFHDSKNKNERISSLLTINRELENKINSLEALDKEINVKVNLMSDENQSLTQQIVCLMQQIDESVPQDAKRIVFDKSVEVDSVTSEIEILKADMDILRMEYEDKLYRRENNNKVLMQKLKNQIIQTRMAEEMAKERTDMALSNAEIEAKLELSTNKNAILETKCQNLEAELDKLQKELNNAIKILKDNSFWRDDDIIISLMSLVSTLTEEKLNAQVCENKCKKLALELQKLEKYPENVPNGDSKVFELDSQILELNNNIKTKDCQITNYDKELTLLHDKIENLTKQYDVLQLQLVTVSSQNIELSDKINDLKNQLHSSGLEIQMLEEKCEANRNTERSLIQSKEQIVREMLSLRKELATDHEEKMELQKLVTELKYALSQVMSSTKEEKSFTSLRRTDFSKTLKILEKSANVKTASLTPLQECVDSLKQEMDVLNRMIRQNSQIRTEISNEISLMDELKMVAER